jgi:hypothetical protein
VIELLTEAGPMLATAGAIAFAILAVALGKI